MNLLHKLGCEKTNPCQILGDRIGFTRVDLFHLDYQKGELQKVYQHIVLDYSDRALSKVLTFSC